VGIVVLLIVLALQLVPLPSGWELVAPVVGVAVLITGALFGLIRGKRAVGTFGNGHPAEALSLTPSG
jgi:hypothetical protein